MLMKGVVLGVLIGVSLVACYSTNYERVPPNEITDKGEDEWWRGRRGGPSLSVVNPIEVLRSRLMMEMARRKSIQQGGGQIEANRLLLKSIGKRAYDRSLEKMGVRLPSSDMAPAWNAL